ncbi:MAG: response regulator [Candidatus Zhuqueibacterota bacterium]
MKKIVIASTDSALNTALNFLFQDRYSTMSIELNSRFISIMQDENIELLIIDSNIIDEEGLKTVGLLKKINSSLPVIALYDMSAPRHFEKELYNIADVMFRKPFSNKQLIDTVQNFIESDARTKLNEALPGAQQ